MAVAAEQHTNQQNILVLEQLPDAIAVPEMHEDAEARQRAARFIGACAVDKTVRFSPEATRPTESLYDAIQKAEHDPEARKLVETNVRTDVIERTIKTGHVIKVELAVDEAGKIQQHGQTMESVQANSLRFAANSKQMRQRTEAETTNAFRIEQHYKDGTLRDYAFVVFSRAADDMSLDAMAETGFFIDTMSTAIQVTTIEDGKLVTESAFVSGIQRPGEARHDAQTLARVGEYYGVDYNDKTATETLNTPVLIHKKHLTNGVVDIVKVWDNSIEGNAFFGEDRPAEDYLTYKLKCAEREASLQPKIDSIVADLLAESSTLQGRVHATQRLAKLSEYHMLQQAVFDRSIDARVFGTEAVYYIEQSRQAFEQGDYEAGLRGVKNALRVAVSSSCPGASGEPGESTLEPERTSSNTANDDCEFVSKKCPMCGAKNVKTKVTAHKISGSCGCSKSK